MLTSFSTIQNAVLAQNMATTRMMQASDRMLSSAVSFGNSQPLKPAFAQDSYNELQMKADETKITVWDKIREAMEKRLAKDIDRSTPKFGGLDYKA